MGDKSLRPFLDLGPILKGRFRKRLNRFLVKCLLHEREEVEAFLPNPGRLWELLLPGATLYLQAARAPTGTPSGSRKTKYTVLAVEREGSPVFLHTHATNGVAEYLLQNGLLPFFKGARLVRSEVSVGRNRFDFLLRKKGKDLYLEVKSCTLFGNKVAMFPDAVTERGRRHLLELAEMGRKGIATAVLFLIHSSHVEWFMPDFHTDLDFSTTVLKVRKDVRIVPVAIGWNKDLTLEKEIRPLDIPWKYLEREVQDRGSYLLLLELRKKKTIEVGQLKRLDFSPGYYLYVGSAMAGLTARMNRHGRRHEVRHWHIDYLTAEADRILPIPVRSSQRLECEIAKSLSEAMKEGPSRFGSTDCKCPTHLFWSPENPLHKQAFHRLLQHFRMRPPRSKNWSSKRR